MSLFPDHMMETKIVMLMTKMTTMMMIMAVAMMWKKRAIQESDKSNPYSGRNAAILKEENGSCKSLS